jgi:8-oxo-dGTP diphosphatase
VIRDAHGTELLELICLDEEALATLSPLTHAVVVARNAGRTVLVFNRKKAHWELAGGGIDPGETPRSCAVRELMEESGIMCEADVLRFAGAIQIRERDGDIEFGALYTADVSPAGPFAPTDEIAAVYWWDEKELLPQLSPVDRWLVEKCRT